jgi:hypothetical protein
MIHNKLQGPNGFGAYFNSSQTAGKTAAPRSLMLSLFGGGAGSCGATGCSCRRPRCRKSRIVPISNRVGIVARAKEDHLGIKWIVAVRLLLSWISGSIHWTARSWMSGELFHDIGNERESWLNWRLQRKTPDPAMRELHQKRSMVPIEVYR